MQADFVLYHSREKGVDFSLENIHVFSQYDTEILDLDQLLMFHLEKGYRLSGNQPKSILKSDSQASIAGRDRPDSIVSQSSNLRENAFSGSRESGLKSSNSFSKSEDVIKRDSVVDRDVNIARRSNIEAIPTSSATR